MGPRGRHAKFKKHSKRNAKDRRNKTRVRKTYSLHQYSHESKEVIRNSGKPQFRFKKHSLKSDESSKRHEVANANDDLSQESEEETEDNMKQLQATFRTADKNFLAIESSDDTESDFESDMSAESIQVAETFDDKLTEECRVNDEPSSNHTNNKTFNYINSKGISKKQIQFEKVDDLVEDDEIDIETQKEDEDSADSKDPFVKHLFYEMNESLQNSLQHIPIIMNTHTEHWPCLGKLFIQIPHCEETNAMANTVAHMDYSIVERKIFAPSGQVPTRINANKETMRDLYLKPQIFDNIIKANKCLIGSERNKSIPLTSLQSEMFSIINNYQDFYYPQRTFENSEEVRFIYCLHAVNHILKTRTKILHHNAKLGKKDDVPEGFRDQGLTRPKILIIVPFRNAAYKIIQVLINILITEDKGNVINKNRFVEDYTGNKLAFPKKNPKPEDYEQMFCGNINDDFRIGITVTKKSLKLYADFYSSDIIIASPLGLRYTVGAEGEPERDYDFLASIEILIFDQTDVFLMQNWDHVLHILDHIHLQPKESHGTDFSRVRQWSLNGWTKYYRQTLIFSSVMLPEINAVFNKKCHNYAGKVKVVNPIQFGSIRQVYVQLPHVFQKFIASTVESAIDARFNYFVNNILSQQTDTLMKQTLIYVSSYFDYVRIRNYFKREDIGFVQICEYSKDAKVARARDMFFHGDAHFLLYTERHHFYNRIRIKGIRHVLFYQPPNFPHFYYEICNLMQEANMNKKIGSMSNMTVTVLYCRYDIQQLAAIISTERATKMIQSERNVHMLVTNAD